MQQDRIPNNILVGMLANALATALGIFLFGLYYSWFKYTDISVFLDSVFSYPNNTIKILGVSQVLSIPIFYYFINRNKTRSAQGIILMFLLLAIATAIIKFS